MIDSPVLSDLLPQLRELMLEVGTFIREERENFNLEDIEFKGTPNDMVSYVDKEAEKKLKAGCAKILPIAGFILEEGDDVNTNAEWRFIIDPLDGTTNFIHDIPNYCISLALQHNSETVVALVYDVPRKEMFTAVAGRGAYRNGKKISVSKNEEMKTALLGLGFPYVKDDRFDDYLAVICDVLLHSRGIRRFGAAALDLCWVACGRMDGYFEMGLNPWDVAAGELIVREAGGAVTDWKGTDKHIFGRQIAATNGNFHPDLLERLRKMV